MKQSTDKQGTEILAFEVLIVDTKDLSTIKTARNVSYSLMGNGSLLKSPSLTGDNKVTDGSISIETTPIAPDQDLQGIFSKAFTLVVKGLCKELEPIRRPLIEYLRKQGFDSCYILTDQVSEQFACELYPLLYKVENKLRHYLVKFMVTRLGPSWWDVTATSELSTKVRSRKNNESVFGEQLIDNKAYLIDFGDLGKMIYAHSSGFTNKEDIIRKLGEIEETPEAIRNLKEQLKSNYQKFFKESFKEKGFQEKWEKLEHLRHKVAHNSLFSRANLDEGKALANDLLPIMEEADKTVASVPLALEEKEAIRESFVANGLSLNVVGEIEFLHSLKEVEQYYSAQKSNSFVGLAHFVRDHLGVKGFEHQSSFSLANKLANKGLIEIYKVPGLDEDHPVTAVKTLLQKAAN